MTSDELKEARSYAWAYFALHADQRMRLFNFFLVLAGAILGAFPAVRNMAPGAKMVSLLPLFLVLSAVIFWRLDDRTRMLVENAEASLKFLDEHWPVQSLDDGTPHYLRLFEREEFFTNAEYRKRWAKWCGMPISYTDNFHIVFLMAGVVGAALALWVLMT